MRKFNSYQPGIGHIISVALLAVVVAIIALVGLRVADMNNHSVQVNNSLPTASTAVPQQIKTKADLQQAEKALNTTTAPDPSVLDNDIRNLY